MAAVFYVTLRFHTAAGAGGNAEVTGGGRSSADLNAQWSMDYVPFCEVFVGQIWGCRVWKST
ncbi:hypothetical protein NSPZN2_90061 [Nitrospira defluvii]|uniref:Uncharacterized protein n=1 Tax=Nitrospira defluvii TaxID=330214 RepID=A0ABN7MGR4_9BACT|nr:hypothetical protein NSPZN2_90061 [Nitrospira defluvii]